MPLNDLGTRFFAYIQLRNLSTVRTGDIVRGLSLTEIQERNLLSRLARQKLIVRVRRGVYRVPERLPIGGVWTPGEYSLLSTLMVERQATWQLCGPNAFNRYGFSDQIPNRLYVYNDRLSGQRVVGQTEILFIKVADDRLGDRESFTVSDGAEVWFSSRIRTLIDAVYDWNRFGTLPQAYQWIQSELEVRPDTAKEIVRLTLKYGNIGTCRRVGKCLETCGVAVRLTNRLLKTLPETSALVRMLPDRPRRGSVDRKWGVLDNCEPLEEQ
jgi:predicted transcriptional regulator of viral defense system